MKHIICYTCVCVCARVILHLCECFLCVIVVYVLLCKDVTVSELSAPMDPKVRAAELKRLRKDPPKQPNLQRSATGFNGVRYDCVKQILDSYTLPSKDNNSCSLTRPEMIDSILRHEATLDYKGNLTMIHGVPLAKEH